MPSLNAMFRLMDGYSSQITKMIGRTDAAMTKILGASTAADQLNDSMGKAGKGAASAASSVKSLGDGASGMAQPVKGLGGIVAGATMIIEGMGEIAAGTAQLIKGLGADAASSAQPIERLGDSAVGAEQPVKSLGDTAASTAQFLTNLSGSATGAAQMVKGVGGNLDGLMQEAQMASTAADKLNQSVIKMGKGAAGAAPPVGNLGSDSAGTALLVKGLGDVAEGTALLIRGLGDNADDAAPSVEKLGNGLDGLTRKSQRAENGLKRLIGTVASLAALKKGMDLTDTYTNTNARLGMITSSPEEQAALRQDVFAAASRSRGDYTEMANAAAKLRMLAGETFSGATGNQEAVAFTELLTKSLKVSGAGTAEQNSAFLQLTQAMTSGKLQGDEFRSVMENAPMVADAIATYMGKSKAELKELSSDGLITADIIKGAMFSAADDINAKFDSMPPTFADNWNRIKNAGMQAFGDMFTRVNNMLNSDMGQAAVNNIITLINMGSRAFGVFLNGIEWAGENLNYLMPILLGVAAGFTAYQVATGLAATAQWLLNSAMLASPIFWIVAGIAAASVVLYMFASSIASTSGAAATGFGIIAGAVNVVIQFFWNLLLTVLNVAMGIIGAVGALGTNMNVAFGNAISGVKAWFFDLLSTALTVISNIAAKLNELPFVNFDYSGIVSAADEYASKSAAAAGEKREYVSISDAFSNGMNTYDAFGNGWVQDAFGAGASWGDDVTGKVSDFFSGFAPDDSFGAGFNFDDFATAGNPATVEGTGKGKAVKVEDEEDIEWMRRLAEREYVARISQNTLAPNIRVEFTGPITKEADTDSVMTHVVDRLKDIIATAPEGVPA